MHPCALLLIFVAAGLAGTHGLPAAAPAHPCRRPSLNSFRKAHYISICIDHSPLKERYAAPYFLPSACLGYKYEIDCGPPHSDKAEAVTGLFFHEAQVRPGSVMTVSFPPAAVQAILPRGVAEKVPFADADAVFATFNIPAGSDEAAKVRDTLRGCRALPLAGERKACATSLEATVRAAAVMLAAAGTPHGRRRVMWAAASAMPRDGLPRRAYTVAAVAALDGDRHVACHDEPFPYAVFQCHMAGQATTKAYMITLGGGGGKAVTMEALCHRDTSSWNPAHPAFEMLHTKPGGAPVCHFMPYANMVFGMKVGVPY